MSEDDPFLTRWSRLKRREPERPNAAPAEAGAPAPDTPAEHAAPAAATEEEPFDLSRLPKLEDLTADSDMRAFLDPRVPDNLRTAALRKAWRLDPQIDTFIEVAENQYDWNTPGGAPGYGPLHPTTDLAALLAQATGHLPLEASQTPKEESDEAARADIAPPPTNDAALQNTAANDAAAPPRPLPARDAKTESAATPLKTLDKSAAADPQAGTQRRRHGSALPR